MALLPAASSGVFFWEHQPALLRRFSCIVCCSKTVKGDLKTFPTDVRAPASLESRESQHATLSCAETIAAIVTPLCGKQGAVAIVRMSGPSAVSVAQAIFRPLRKKKWIPQSHRVVYGTIIEYPKETIIDEVIIVPMLAPRSYTREDVVEIQCHGGDVCVRRILDLCLQHGARLAQPGEFTLRAFLNGRIDLSQAENVAQLVSAKTASAAETALAGLQGGLSNFVRSMRSQCIELLAEIDAHVDFEDELAPLDVDKIMEAVGSVSAQVEQALETAARGRLLQSGIQVAIVGRPNVGKSSLLNGWSQSERAIVTDVAGTTRDIVEADVVVSGVPVRLLDTAGIRITEDPVESIGVQRSQAAATGADVLVMVINACDGWTTGDKLIFDHTLQQVSFFLRLYQFLNSISPELPSFQALREQPWILVMNKIDQVCEGDVTIPEDVRAAFSAVVSTCAVKEALDIDKLDTALAALIAAGGDVFSAGQQHWAVNERQKEQLIRAKQALERLRQSAHEELPVDLWTVDLRDTILALGQISGDDVSEEVLANIFSRFCIGK
ncbi:uncharacterized protein LOC9650872 isoform X1 [Selaginella moellendorffii]|uniref:uncharacterized protein LOC9650872 isoform X1 n=1 Tax=Selaginella moellendorffii TaxID=88036 RepID=UPI000D1C7D16|nr:uncharacterized protein LOC9650872 isoform X1 [Selaginella moellendorffii]|eukprot:XP_024533024.1 uncharacterized protein LOC9650872 isoform X1 [Selaginella moellendorffii]